MNAGLQLPSKYVESGAVIVDDDGVRFNPEHTYILFRGGRGRAGSWTMISVALMMALSEPMDILVLRSSKNKIKESVWKLIENTAIRLGLEDKVYVTKTYIATVNGSRFFYDHMHNNEHGIRSTENVRLTLGEECQDWQYTSIKALIPTITRNNNSQFVGCLNPQYDDDPIETEIMADPDCLTVNATIMDNPFAPEKLIREMVKQEQNDYEAYQHIWLGGYNIKSDEIVFAGHWEIGEVPHDSGAQRHFGLDYGFGGHPTAYICSFIENDIIYIEDEQFLYNSTIEKISGMLDGKRIKGQYIFADVANAGDNRYLMNRGHRVQGFKKDNINTGLYWLRSHRKIVVAPHCKNIIEEFKKYRWKKDRHTDKILDETVKEYDHGIDALRYAWNREIKLGV